MKPFPLEERFPVNEVTIWTYIYKHDWLIIHEIGASLLLIKSFVFQVMQVKNFGRSGRTKYTHLVDQDTTDYDASWTAESASNIKFQQKHAAGMKQVFERPGRRKN